MKPATTAHARAEEEVCDDALPPRSGTTEAGYRSGTRMKAARPVQESEALALAMTDALEHILDDERRTA